MSKLAKNVIMLGRCRLILDIVAVYYQCGCIFEVVSGLCTCDRRIDVAPFGCIKVKKVPLIFFQSNMLKKADVKVILLFILF